jgi:NADH-quinone oxidoreductase subunit L
MSQNVWLVPLFPLIGFLITGFINRSLSKSLTGIIASGSVLASFVVSILIAIEQHHAHEGTTVTLWQWINTGGYDISFSFLVDRLSSLFLLIITGVGFLIHVYSTGYMHDDDGFRRFFAYLNLFIFFMLLLVLGDNFLLMFVGWEGVGLCSYLLIGYWFKNTEYNNAAKKAFIMNRIGDLGFLLGIILIFITFGSISYSTVFGSLDTASTAVLTTITLLLFVGATGKSAQIPLLTWLPDAMAGPTPVSALIHAATMVTAGIYMIARASNMFILAPFTMEVIALTGLLTALVGASIGIFQNDIKKVLAYSTVSQLGLMFLGLGVAAFTGSVFHVMTHAFFKALLFLAAGSVIHAMSGEQDIRKMGSLKSKLPYTYWTFLIGTLALTAVPPFAAFFSKDEMLVHVFAHNKVYGFLAIGVSIMTTFYMFRLLFLTFFGSFRGTEEQQHHLHESPASMTVPLVVLAILSTISGFWGFPQFEDTNIPFPNLVHEFLHPVFANSDHVTQVTLGDDGVSMLLATLAILATILIARYLYITKGTMPANDESELSFWQKILARKYYLDEIYSALITRPLDRISGFFSSVLDTKIIDGFVNGIGTSVKGSGQMVRLLQTGKVDFYLFVMVISVILILMIAYII